MLPNAALRLLFVAPILIIAAAFLGVSALVILRGRPLIVKGSLFPWLIAASILPLVAAVIVIALSASDPTTTCMATLQAGILVLFIVGARRSTHGYIVVAVTGESLRSALRGAIADLNFPFEETILGFSLGTIHNTVRTRYEPRLGAAQIWLEAQGSSEVLSQIANRVRDHLQADYQSASYGSAALYGALGLITLILALYQSSRF